jgi:YedE family putative selenium metabolism protein
MLVLILLLIVKPEFISFSKSGAGAHHAAIWISLGVGLAVGFMAQRTRLCFMAGWRDLFLIKNTEFFSGIAAFFLAALITNYAVGNFSATGFYHWGFTSEPYAVNNQLWNFTSMVLVGLASALLGGCPLRQMILSGEGDTDAGLALLGFFAGAPIAQNFLIKSNDTFFGVNTFGPLAVIIGLAFCITIGFAMREKS